MSGTGGFPNFNSLDPRRNPGLKPSWFIGVGAFFVALGVLAFLDTVLTTLASMVVIGVLLFMAGVAQLAQSFAHRGVPTSTQWLSALIGVLYILGGLLLIDEPVTGSIFLTAFLAGCLIFTGVARFVWAAGHRTIGNWWGFLLSGVVALLTGILVYATLPWSGLWLIGTFIAIELIIGGVSAIMFGVSLNKAERG
ncbi:HdeD family acid-resistance protein [Kozakia baliensis]|uniref:HdeD family acid-resistance protein n=1 Tax=Kozakia baliensis TaxID=153496 RepID=UPI00345BAE2E